MGPFSRRVLVATSVLCFIAAFALTPSEVRSHAGAIPARIDQTISDPVDTAARIIAPTVDPFVPQAIDDGDGRPSPVPPSRPVDTLHLGPLPANLGATLNPLVLDAATGVRVRAIAVGTHSSAVVSDGTDTHIVAVGDRLGAATVTSIDGSGITLSDRRRLTLAHGQQP